ncbi:MAG: YitT family protein [Bacilli bacterium]|nr:YitT family protein [Bacilli bacterium]
MKYKNYIYLIILLFIAAINFNIFLKPLSLVCGGTQGIAIIINKITKLDYFFIILIINILMFFLSIIFLNKKITISLIISTFIYPIFIRLTNNISYSFNIFILNIITVGIISGITNGFIYKFGFTSSGISLLGPFINKYTNIKIGTINFIINLIIMILNLIIFGIENVIYSLIVISINSLVINLILYKKN